MIEQIEVMRCDGKDCSARYYKKDRRSIFDAFDIGWTVYKKGAVRHFCPLCSARKAVQTAELDGMKRAWVSVAKIQASDSPACQAIRRETTKLEDKFAKSK